MLKFLLLGLGLGGIYAVSALGIVTIYRGSRVLNLAHGGIALWGAHLFVELRDVHELHAGLATAVSLAASATAGCALYLVVFRPLRQRTELVKLVASLGVLVVLQALAVREMGTATRLVRSSLPNDPIVVLGHSVGRDRLILLGIAVGVAALLALWSATSRLALATLAQARHEEATASLGYSPVLLGTLSWGLGSVLAALSGILIVPIAGLGARGVFVIVVPALVAALVGRFESYGWAVVGGLVLGVVEAEMTRYVSAPGWSSAAPFIVVVLILLSRRDHGLNRLASTEGVRVSSGRLRPQLAGPALALAVGAVVLSSDARADGLATSFTFALLALSLVVLLGFTNQVSLAQLATAGLGALAAARCSIELGLPFELAPVVGALAGAAVGLVAGLPALRIRGLNLAIVTAGLAVAIERAVFENASLTGGFNGLAVEQPTFFGAQVDALSHPRGYAAVCLLWLVLALGAVSWLRRSSAGRAMLAVRTNERAAAAQGISVARTKLLAFTISSALAGLAGVLLAFRQRTVVFNGFDVFTSIELIAITVFAGAGTLLGPLLAGLVAPGGVLLSFVDSGSFLDTYSGVIFGVNLLLVLWLHPSGLLAPRRMQPDVVELRPTEEEAGPGVPLVVERLGVRYGGVQAVQDVSITVLPGEVVGLIGPNGAGKTTALDAISGFAPASSGSIRLGERDLSALSPAQRARAGVARVFQSLELIDDLSVGENVVLGTSPGRAPGGQPVSALVVEILERARLSERLDASPREISLGQRGLVSIARSLATRPAVLLLDEPAAGLSATERTELVGLVRRVAAHGTGVLLVEHDVDVVWQACDRVLVMVGGANFASGTADEIAQDQSVRDVYLGRGHDVDPVS